jgi:hypothetical protein
MSLATDQVQLATLVARGDHSAVDAQLASMHTAHHANPLDHVRVHLAWMRVQFARLSLLGALFHAFAGFVVAAPASLVQRHTGLVVPAFDATRPR